MKQQSPNPFNITKAVDFSDQQINDYWIDLPGGGGFHDLAKPSSPMPMLILGGKGSGKTHLMRYFSYSLQRIRHGVNILDGLKTDRYIGIYLRCGGLNSGRFKEKGQSDAAWADVFSYYFDLWLAQQVVHTVCDAFADLDDLRLHEKIICQDVWGQFDSPDGSPPNSLGDLIERFRLLQSQVDSAVNNFAILGKLDVAVRSTRGKLVFGLPRIIAEHLPLMSDCLFVYLIDEFENLLEPQQKYMNTLIREKEPPSSFKVGARMYGVRTFRTFSADEENKEGSEFEIVRLDALLRANKNYRLFAKQLIVRRLSEHGFITGDKKAQEAMVRSLGSWFEDVPQGKFSKNETSFVITKYEGRERPYFEALRAKLTKKKLGPESVSTIIGELQCSEYPLLEKVNIFLLYKDWSRKKDLVAASEQIQKECQAYLGGDARRQLRYTRAIEHFKVDLMAQLLRECDQKQRYVGIDTFIDMSMGLPRNLLILLKNIFSWAVYFGEQPFRDIRAPISLKAQQSGVSESAEWFFGDARTLGADGRFIQDSISRLGTLFRAIRFSDKPIECSCTSFNCDLTRISDEARRIIDIAQKWSLLIDVGERRDSKTKRVDPQLQLNPMLAPRWDLAIYRRGVIALSPDEVNAIFDEASKEKFASMLQNRIARMSAPFFGNRELVGAQATLWTEPEDD